MSWLVFHNALSIRCLTFRKAGIVALAVLVLLPMAAFADNHVNVHVYISPYEVYPPYRDYYLPLEYGYLPLRYPDSPYPSIRAAITGEPAPYPDCRLVPRVILEPYAYRYLPFGLVSDNSFPPRTHNWGADGRSRVNIFQRPGNGDRYDGLRMEPANSYCDEPMLFMIPE